MKKEKIKFPKGFFTKERPILTTKQALKDVIPAELMENKNSKVSSKTKKI